VNCTQKLGILHSKKRCWMASGLLQKHHDLSPFWLRSAKLSLVGITLLWKKQRKILIFEGILTRQTNCDTLIPILTRKLYIDFTVKNPILMQALHKDISLPCYRLKLATRATRWFHSRSLFPTTALLNSTLSGVSLRPLQPMRTFLSYKIEKCWVLGF
jgi:hypothetical protein